MCCFDTLVGTTFDRAKTPISFEILSWHISAISADNVYIIFPINSFQISE